MTIPRKFTSYYGVLETLKDVGNKPASEREQWLRLNLNSHIRVYLERVFNKTHNYEFITKFPTLEYEKRSLTVGSLHNAVRIIDQLADEGLYGTLPKIKKDLMLKNSASVLTKEESHIIKDMVKGQCHIKGITKALVEKVL